MNTSFFCNSRGSYQFFSFWKSSIYTHITFQIHWHGAFLERSCSMDWRSKQLIRSLQCCNISTFFRDLCVSIPLLLSLLNHRRCWKWLFLSKLKVKDGRIHKCVLIQVNNPYYSYQSRHKQMYRAFHAKCNIKNRHIFASRKAKKIQRQF